MSKFPVRKVSKNLEILYVIIQNIIRFAVLRSGLNGEIFMLICLLKVGNRVFWVSMDTSVALITYELYMILKFAKESKLITIGFPKSGLRRIKIGCEYVEIGDFWGSYL